MDNVPNIIKNIIHKIRNLNETQGIGLEEMAIIGPVKKSKPNGEFYTNIGLSLFTNIFHNEGISYVKHYEDGADGGSDIDRDIQYKAGHINLFTIHGSKGLEFKVVFLINFHLNTFGISPTEEDYHRFKYLWYVGLSRAAEHLHIYIDERKYGFFDLKNVRLQDVIYETKFPKLLPQLTFKDEIKPLTFNVTEILRNKKYMNDKLYHFFYEALGPKEVTKVPLWNNKSVGLPEFYELENMDFYKIYGITPITSYSETSDMKFLTDLKSKLDYKHIVSDSSQFSSLGQFGISEKLAKDLYQPIQLFYFENDSLKSYHINCTAKGGLNNINWNTAQRFEQFIPKSAVQLDSINLTLSKLKLIYPSIKNEKKYTIVIFYSLMFQKISKLAMQTVEQNLERFHKVSETDVYFINIDRFYKNVL